MQTNVAVHTLVEILSKNRENHRELYLIALEEWRDQLVEELSRWTEEVKAGRQVLIRSKLPVPEDHTEDYDAVLKMLELSQDDNVQLSEHDIEEYVLDRWGWRASFAANTLRYTSGRQE